MNEKISLSEKIITRLNAGENFESILNTLKADEKIKAQEISDWWEFMEAQKLNIKPSKSAFKSTINQAILLSNTKTSDDEVTGWGSFFQSFHLKTFGIVSFSLLLVLGVSQEFLGNFIKFESEDTKEITLERSNLKSKLQNISGQKKVKTLAFKAKENMDFSHILKDIKTQENTVVVLDNLDLDDQFVKDLESDFNADIEDFYQTQKTLKSLSEETLFEDGKQDEISKLYKKNNSPILATSIKNFYL